jgi:hypothetical protein
MTYQPIDMRTVILSSWHGAMRKADATSVVTLTAASFAGYLLEATDGDIELAHRLVPVDGQNFFDRVAVALYGVECEEAPARSIGGTLRRRG